jgi:hypothetical protein
MTVREPAPNLGILNEFGQLQQDGKVRNRVVARDHRAAGCHKGLRPDAWELAMATRAHRSASDWINSSGGVVSRGRLLRRFATPRDVVAIRQRDQRNSGPVAHHRKRASRSSKPREASRTRIARPKALGKQWIRPHLVMQLRVPLGRLNNRRHRPESCK